MKVDKLRRFFVGIVVSVVGVGVAKVPLEVMLWIGTTIIGFGFLEIALAIWPEEDSQKWIWGARVSMIVVVGIVAWQTRSPLHALVLVGCATAVALIVFLAFWADSKIQEARAREALLASDDDGS